jgi:hypothetical protein
MKVNKIRRVFLISLIALACYGLIVCGLIVVKAYSLFHIFGIIGLVFAVYISMIALLYFGVNLFFEAQKTYRNAKQHVYSENNCQRSKLWWCSLRFIKYLFPIQKKVNQTDKIE